MASSVATIPLRVDDESGGSATRPPLAVNVLAEDYWEVNAVLR